MNDRVEHTVSPVEVTADGKNAPTPQELKNSLMADPNVPETTKRKLEPLTPGTEEFSIEAGRAVKNRDKYLEGRVAEAKSNYPEETKALTKERNTVVNPETLKDTVNRLTENADIETPNNYPASGKIREPGVNGRF